MIQFLPGDGEVVGARLVEHPGVAVIAFTGSKAVGLAINRQAAVPAPGSATSSGSSPRWCSKNALVIDADADPDQAVLASSSRAKCSAAGRLIVVGDVYDQVVDRLVAATTELVVGLGPASRDPGGPVIDEDAPQADPPHAPGAHRQGPCSCSTPTSPTRALRAAHGRRRRRSRHAADPWARCSGRCSQCCGPPTWMERSPSPTAPTMRSPLVCTRVRRRHRRCSAAAAGRQRLREPPDHGRRGQPPAVRGLRPVGRRVEGGAGPTTCCSSSIPGSSPRTPSGRGSRPTCERRRRPAAGAAAAR